MTQQQAKSIKRGKKLQSKIKITWMELRLMAFSSQSKDTTKFAFLEHSFDFL